MTFNSCRHILFYVDYSTGLPFDPAVRTSVANAVDGDGLEHFEECRLCRDANFGILTSRCAFLKQIH